MNKKKSLDAHKQQQCGNMPRCLKKLLQKNLTDLFDGFRNGARKKPFQLLLVKEDPQRSLRRKSWSNCRATEEKLEHRHGFLPVNLVCPKVQFRGDSCTNLVCQPLSDPSKVNSKKNTSKLDFFVQKAFFKIPIWLNKARQIFLRGNL